MVFAALWIAGQAALVLTAGGRPDHIFGFRMFPEASTIEIHLWRDDGRRRRARRRGASGARATRRDSSGTSRGATACATRSSRRSTRASSPRTASTRSSRASQHALDDVADHVPEDAETRQLRAEVVVTATTAAGPGDRVDSRRAMRRSRLT